MSAALNLARWLVRDQSAAEDVVQESYLRAFKYFGSYHHGDSRACLLTIVRNTSYNWLRQNRSRDLRNPIDDVTETIAAPNAANPEMALLQRIDHEVLRQTLSELPIEFREILVLREMEGFSYKEIAALADLPIGTVMSRLARARARLQQRLAGKLNQEI